ncbi:uncharacterized protein LOC135705422 [Ochlerotatus camptorhynchus]|uniref:uncharacterized protein LOC135705422 n=1 Tax=Ochlerotatus camptorhynchus TaxID=644619 RepID=UPI0031D6AD04
MQTNWRLRRQSLIFNEGLRLLMECKVPDFSSQQDPDDRAQMQRRWSEGLLDVLPQFLNFIERHRKTLFYEECGPVTWEFRKYFLLVYFEQISLTYEYGWFQMNGEDDDGIEYRLSKFCMSVDNILTRDANSGIRCWLFHYYGSVLGMEGWQHRAGEVYSFVRLFHFLVEYDRVMDVQFAPRVLSFVEMFGKQLLTCRQVTDYQMMGLMLMNTLMKHTCKNHRYFRHDNEVILELVLPLIWKETASNTSAKNLWNVIYYSARSMCDKNPSLDDEIMRTLLALLNENEDDIDQSHVHLRTVTRLLLLDAPEIMVQGPEVFTVFGRRFEQKEFRSYVRNRLQGYAEARNYRYSFHWRLRIGQIIPKLITRFAIFSTRCYFSRYYLQELNLLVWVVMFPIGQTWQRQRAQGTMLNCLLSKIETTTRSVWESLEQSPIQDMALLQEWHLQHNVLVALSGTIADAFLELVQNLRRDSEQVQSLIRSVLMQMMGAHYMLENLNRTLERLINAAKKIRRAGNMVANE